MKGNNVIAEIAKYTGYSEQTIRVWMQSGKCPFGTAFKQEGNSYYTYIVYPDALERMKKGAEATAPE